MDQDMRKAILKLYQKDRDKAAMETEIDRLIWVMDEIVEIQKFVEEQDYPENIYEDYIEPIVCRLAMFRFDVLHHKFIPVRLNDDEEFTLSNFTTPS